MKVERFPCGYDVLNRFPNARRFKGWEGGCAYKAEHEGKAYLILDEGTMADFLDEDDQDLVQQLISVIEFNNEAEREAYIAEHMAFGVNLECEEWKR
jgi:hypothetical protein